MKYEKKLFNLQTNIISYLLHLIDLSELGESLIKLYQIIT